jgi:arylformamidase
MCESCNGALAKWNGWIDIPQPRTCEAIGDWIDLTHCLTEELARIPPLPPQSFRKISRLSERSANVTEMQMAVHIGTHVDAPCHFVVDGPAAHEVPLDRLYGPGVIWKIDVPPLGLIDVVNLESARPVMQRGDIVLISTGWARRIGTPDYWDHPSLTVAAAEWLLERGAKVVGMDFSTPDLPVHVRQPGFDWPVHRKLLANGVLIAEHLTGLDPLENSAVEVMFLGLNIRDSDGMPARAVARAIRV